MHKFQSNSNDFVRRTRRRIIIEVSVLLLLAGYFWSGWSDTLPNWSKLSVLILFTAYILFGLAYYPKAKLIAQNFSVFLTDEALGFSSQGNLKQIPYRDLIISKVSKKNGEVVAIYLKTTFGQSIKLQGLENMQELYEGIVDHVGEKGT